MQELLQGLGLLYRCDPSVTVSVTEHGEFQLGCCGEVHLEKCIGDLEHLYALVPIRVSPPYVSFRETIVDPSLVPDERTHLKNKITDSTVDHLERISDRIPFPPWGSSSRRARRDDLPTGTVCGVTSDKRSQVWLRAEMMRPEALAWLSEQTNSLNLAKASASALAEISATFLEHQTLDPQTFSVWFLTSDNKGMVNALVWRKRADVPSDYCFVEPTTASAIDCLAPFVSLGFQKAMAHGPLANEIVRGVVIVIEDLLVPSETESQVDEDSEFSCNTSMHKETRSTLNSSIPYGPQGGQLTSATLEACREAILRRGLVRLFEPILRLDMHCHQNVLGAVYSCLSRRRAQIQGEDVKEGSPNWFHVWADLPAADSRGVAVEIRSKGKGQVMFHLTFSHWRLLNVDPFPEASLTVEDVEEGDVDLKVLSQEANVARRLVMDVRTRKGLPTGRKVVVSAEKQRNLKH